MENSTPSQYISSILRKNVVVKLYNGCDYKGILAGLDERMNLAMEDTVEYMDGKEVKTYGDAFIRGNNVYYISHDRKPQE